MGKSLSLFSLMFCSLCTTFFYQNCAQVEDSMTQNSVVSEITFLPVFTDEIRLFDLNTESKNCKPINEVLFSKAHNLCIEIKDSCAFSGLVELGFQVIDKALKGKIESNDFALDEPEPDLESRVSNCQIFVDTRELKTDFFKSISPSSLGYESQPETMCSQSLIQMVNFKTRSCSLARNGCQASYLREKGFVNDFYSFCPNEN